jgi:type VI protein secretion system component VasF
VIGPISIVEEARSSSEVRMLNMYVLTWVVVALGALALGGYRFTLGNREDDTIHLAPGEAGMITFQARVAKRIRTVGRIGVLVTALAVIYGTILVGYWAYGVWLQGNRIAFH